MCKFNNRLFVFSLLTLLGLSLEVLAKPALQQYENQESGNIDLLGLTSLLTAQDNYDLHYDQRQKGNENYRLKLDGFFIGIPQEESSSLLLLTDDIFESLGDDLFSDSDNNKKEKPTNLDLDLDNFQKPRRPLQSLERDTPKPAPVLVEIPAPNKQGEARHYGDDEVDHSSSRQSSRTKSYISHLLGLLKRGHRN